MASKRVKKKPGQAKRAPLVTAEQRAAIAAEVKRRRQAAGLTLRQAAALAHVHTSAVGAIEQGRVTPALGTLIALAGALGCEVADLVNGLRTQKN
jgi:transcriptional regulator with XRE-family HTH domain